MTIQVLSSTADPEGPTNTRIFFTLVGLASDGSYRQSEFSELSGSVVGGEDDIITFIDIFIVTNAVAIQTAIDAGALAISTDENAAKTRDLRDEARQFLTNNPTAKAIIDLDGPALETVIETRTAAQETLLLKTLAFAVRFLFESVKLT